jgi:hypothetical protein
MRRASRALAMATSSGSSESAPVRGKPIWKPYPHSPPYRTGKTKGGRALPTRALPRTT